MCKELSSFPNWFRIEDEYNLLLEQGLTDFTPWIVMRKDRIFSRLLGMQNRYPSRYLIPFATRDDNDDVACWEKDRGVVIIHDYATSGFEGGKDTTTFWEWFKRIVEDMIEYNS